MAATDLILLHRFQKLHPWATFLLEVVFNRFDDHNGVIHHQADGKDHTEKRKRIDGETEQRKKAKCPNQGDGNRKERNHAARQPWRK